MKINKTLFCVIITCFGSFQSICQNNQLLSLEDCVRLAMNRNNNLKRGNLEIQKNAIYHEQALNSVYPSVNASLSPSGNLGRSIDPYSNQFVDRNIFSTSLAINSNFTIFNGFQIQNGINQTSINQEISQLSLESMKTD